MIPTGLKIGDTFIENFFEKQVLFRVIGFDGQGNYISKVVEDEKEVIPVDDLVNEELPFTTPDDELVETETAETEKVETETTEDTTEEETVKTETVEEQPIVEEVKKEVKKPATKKTTSKKKTTKKK